MLCWEANFRIMLYVVRKVYFWTILRLNLNLIMLLLVAAMVQPDTVLKVIVSIDVRVVDVEFDYVPKSIFLYGC